MSPRLAVFGMTAVLLGTLNGMAQPQVDVHTALVKSSRVIALPFANYSGTPHLRQPLLHAVREWLIGHGTEVVDSLRVANVLRENRIRNTVDLSVADLQTLSRELDAAYVIAGSAHRLVINPEFSEFSLVAYLIYVPEVRVDWCGSAVIENGGSRTLFTGTVETDTIRMINKAVARLFRNLDFKPDQRRPKVTALRSLPRIGRPTLPCDRIAVVPLSNETTTPFAGEFITDHLMVALFRRGFTVIDPGRVRQSMLEAEDLTRGQTSGDVLSAVARTCGADIILTGSVSSITTTSESRFGDIPSLGIELRLIDCASGNILWANHITRRGDDSEKLFGAGITSGTGALTRRAATAAVKSIPVIRRRAGQS